MNNVIQFPKKKDRQKYSPNFDVEYLDFLTEDITEDFLEFLLDEGYQIDDPQYIFEISMLYETLKSLLYKMNELSHPLQDLAYDFYSDFYDREKDEEIYVPEQLEFKFDNDDEY